MVIDIIRRCIAALRRWFARRSVALISVVAYRPLQGGAALYAADVDGRRIVFTISARSACLLASYPRPQASGEEVTALGV